MIQTMKRVVIVDDIKIGLASVHNDTGKAFLQTAILYGNQFTIASTSLYFPATSIMSAENKLKSITDDELTKILKRIQAYDSFSNSLSTALENAQDTHQPHTPQVTHHQSRKTYKRVVN